MINIYSFPEVHSSPCSTAAAGCGWCYYENKCMAGTLGESSPIVMEVGADGITPESPPPCKGEGNWSFGGGRCDCYKKCDACTENDCGTQPFIGSKSTFHAHTHT